MNAPRCRFETGLPCVAAEGLVHARPSSSLVSHRAANRPLHHPFPTAQPSAKGRAPSSFEASVPTHAQGMLRLIAVPAWAPTRIIHADRLTTKFFDNLR